MRYLVLTILFMLTGIAVFIQQLNEDIMNEKISADEKKRSTHENNLKNINQLQDFSQNNPSEDLAKNPSAPLVDEVEREKIETLEENLDKGDYRSTASEEELEQLQPSETEDADDGEKNENDIDENN